MITIIGASMLWLGACSSDEMDSKYETLPRAKVTKKGDFETLSGDFPQGALGIGSMYGVETPIRILQRAWRMTVNADAFKNVDKSVIDGVSQIMASQNSKDMGLDLNHPILGGVYQAPEGILIRFHATDANKAVKGVEAVLKELKVDKYPSIAAKAKGDALWVFFASKDSKQALGTLLEKPKFSSNVGFSKIQKMLGKGKDFQMYISIDGMNSMLSSNRETQDFARMNILEDFGAATNIDKDGMEATFVQNFTEGSPLIAVQINTAKDTFISKLPAQSNMYLKSNMDFQGIWNALSEGKAGEMGVEVTKELDAQFKSQRESLLKAYEGPFVVTVLPALKEDKYPITPIGYFKTKDSTFFADLLPLACGVLQGSMTKVEDKDFCRSDDFALGIWDDHVIAMANSGHLDQMGKTKGGFSKRLKPSFDTPALLSFGIDPEPFIKSISSSPKMVTEANGFEGALGIATLLESIEGYYPEYSTFQLNIKDSSLIGSMNYSGGIESLGAVYGVGILAAIAIPNFVSMQYKSKRAEIPQNIKAIKIAQLAYEQNYDVYVKCAAYPSTPTKTTQQWTKSSSGGFRTIDFQPDVDVRGSYMVSTTSTNFTVIGISDIDGDGVYATYIATKSENPNSPITAPDVY